MTECFVVIMRRIVKNELWIFENWGFLVGFANNNLDELLGTAHRCDLLVFSSVDLFMPK